MCRRGRTHHQNILDFCVLALDKSVCWTNTSAMVHAPPTFEEMANFVATATSKGWIGSTSGQAMQSTLRRVKPVLDERETSDVKNIDVGALIRRFANLNREVGSASLKSYASRLGSAIKMFREWRDDPASWRPRSTGGAHNKNSPRTRKSRSVEATEISAEAADKVALAGSPDGTLSYPFPLRDGVIMRFVGLPRDLNQSDVERISRFLRVLCAD